MRRAIIVAALVVAGLAPAREASAGGFLLYEHSALSTGMANSRTALWDDTSSMFHNPAAITQLPGVQFSLGDTLIFPTIDYDPSLPNCTESVTTECGKPASTEPGVFYPVHLYVTGKINSWLSVGFGLNNPVGMGTFWPEDWDGQFTAWQTDLKTFFFQPAVAVDFARLAHLPDEFSISMGVGGYYVLGHALIKSKVYLPASSVPGGPGVAEMHLEGMAHSGGYHFSFFAAYKPWISFGVSVRSNVPLTFEGTAEFHAPEGEPWVPIAEAIGLLPASTGGSTTIDLPWNIAVGIAFHGIPKTTIAFDANITLWQSYDELVLDFACATMSGSVADGACSSELNAGAQYPKDWNTGIQLSVGAEVRPIPTLALRLGYGYVTDPTSPEHYDAMLPDGNRNLLTAGIGWRAPRIFKVDLGYMFAFWEGEKENEVGEPVDLVRNGTANGTYITKSHLIAITLGFSFGGPENGKPSTLAYEPIIEEPAALPPATAEPLAAEPVAAPEPVVAEPVAVEPAPAPAPVAADPAPDPGPAATTVAADAPAEIAPPPATTP